MIYAVIQAKGSSSVKLLARDRSALDSFILAYNLETKKRNDIVFLDEDIGTIVILPEDFKW